MKKLLITITATALYFSLPGYGLMEDAFTAGVITILIIAAVSCLLIVVLHTTWIVLSKRFLAIRTDFQGFWDEKQARCNRQLIACSNYILKSKIATCFHTLRWTWHAGVTHVR